MAGGGGGEVGPMITSTSVVIVLCWLVFQTSTHSPHLSPCWSGMARGREASADSTLRAGYIGSHFARPGGAGSVPRPGLGQGRNQHATKAWGTLACDGPNLHNEPLWRTLASHPANALSTCTAHVRRRLHVNPLARPSPRSRAEALAKVRPAGPGGRPQLAGVIRRASKRVVVSLARVSEARSGICQRG